MKLRCGQAGFTLVEMLISLALLSLLALGMASALSSMGQTQERVDERSRRADEFQATTAFVQGILGLLSDRRMALQQQGQGTSPFLFLGQRHAIEWLGVMPARHGMGGRYFFRLSLEPYAGEQALMLRYQPWQAEMRLPDWSGAQMRVLAPDVLAFEAAYGGADMPPAQWDDQWTSPDALPVRVRLAVTTRDGAWPLWIIPARILSAGGGRAETYVSGPGK